MFPPRVALLACSVFEGEILHYAADAKHIVETRWFEIGLHDRPEQLRATLQAGLDAADSRDDIDAIVLAYGLCGRGTAGLKARCHRFVIPRAHDCITLFMGSKEAYADHQRTCPSCYYYTPGWNRARRVPGPDRLGMLQAEWERKFDADNIQFLLQSEREQWARYDTATYLDLGTSDAEREADYSRQCAEWLRWRFERITGDATLLRDLLWGKWDKGRFQIIEPGMQVGQAADDAVLRAEPSGSGTSAV